MTILIQIEKDLAMSPDPIVTGQVKKILEGQAVLFPASSGQIAYMKREREAAERGLQVLRDDTARLYEKFQNRHR
jgi:hypothetical protein